MQGNIVSVNVKSLTTLLTQSEKFLISKHQKEQWPSLTLKAFIEESQLRKVVVMSCFVTFGITKFLVILPSLDRKDKNELR